MVTLSRRTARRPTLIRPIPRILFFSFVGTIEAHRPAATSRPAHPQTFRRIYLASVPASVAPHLPAREPGTPRYCLFVETHHRYLLFEKFAGCHRGISMAFS